LITGIFLSKVLLASIHRLIILDLILTFSEQLHQESTGHKNLSSYSGQELSEVDKTLQSPFLSPLSLKRRAGWFHTNREKILSSWLAKARWAWGIVRKPRYRAIVMKKLCNSAQLTGALPPRLSGKSSQNVTSLTQCNRFSIPQCP